MGKSVVVDTNEMQRIAGANAAIASSVSALFNLADHLPAEKQAAVRVELDKVLAQAKTILSSVQTVIRENQ